MARLFSAENLSEAPATAVAVVSAIGAPNGKRTQDPQIKSAVYQAVNTVDTWHWRDSAGIRWNSEAFVKPRGYEVQFSRTPLRCGLVDRTLDQHEYIFPDTNRILP